MYFTIDGNLATHKDWYGNIYKLANKLDGTFQDNPDEYDCDPATFDRIFSGHGIIIHLSDNPTNRLYFTKPNEAFTNPEKLPKGTTNVFLELVEIPDYMK